MEYPDAIDRSKVGTYAGAAAAGGGYVWDAVLEYRVWWHPGEGRDDCFQAFSTYAEALSFMQRTADAEEPVALILQQEYLEEPEPGRFVHVTAPRVTEWPVEFLSRPRRNPRTIPDFLSPGAPANRLDILRGVAR